MSEEIDLPAFHYAEDGRYYLRWRGETWGLLTPVSSSWHWHSEWGWELRRMPYVEISFRMAHLPAPPPPRKPKRTWARSMGLRRPS